MFCRSRDKGVLSLCNIVVDVGGEYNHAAMKYDHHQRLLVLFFNFSTIKFFRSSENYYKSEIESKANVPVFFSCGQCDKSFSSISSLEKISRNHSYSARLVLARNTKV